MISNESNKSGHPKLPLAYPNGHNSPANPVLNGGGLYVDPEPLGQSAGPPEGGEVSIVRALRRCWLPALFFGLLGAGAAGAATWYLWPSKYLATALVHVPPRPGLYGEDLQLNVRSNLARLKGRGLIEAALRDERVLKLAMIRESVDPVAAIEKNLQADSNLGPDILRASLSGDRPDELPIVLNAVVDAYIRDLSDGEQKAYKAKTNQLEENRKYYERELNAQRKRLRGMEDIHGPEALQTSTQRAELFRQQFAAFDKELRQTQIDRKVAARELEVFSARENDPSNAATDLAVEDYLRQDARSTQLQTELFKLDQDIARLRQVATEAGQASLEGMEGRRAALAAALDARRKEVRPLVERLSRAKTVESARENRAKLEARKVGLEERERQLQAQIVLLKKEGREPSLRFPEIDTARDAIVSLESGLKKANEEIDKLKIEAPNVGRVAPLDRATEPKSKNLDRQLKMAGLAGIGGFGVLFAGIFWREVRTRRVYGAQDVTQRLGTNVLGTLPILPARARRLLSTGREGYWHALLGESVDAIRTQLLRAAQTEGLKVVMVSSALGGEGKTSLATHLAISLARAWRKTLLIDGDLRKPAIHQQFEQTLEPGFCDVLRGELDFTDVVRPTSVSRLWMIPAGQCDPHALQALAQDTLSALLEPLKEQYDFIIIDSSPVLPVADSLSLGQHVDGVIFSILRDVSRVPAVQAAYQRLTALGIRVLGNVVIGAGDEPAQLGYNVGSRAHAAR